MLLLLTNNIGEVKMKKIIVALMLIFVCSNAAADEILRNGAWWNQRSHEFKIAYLIGFFDGRTSGGNQFDSAMMIACDKDYLRAKAKGQIDLVAKGERINSNGNKLYMGISVAQFSDGLDKIYSEYQNTNISTIQVMLIVARNFYGMTESDKLELLEISRKAAHDTEKQ
jgi:hypothetical protein